MMGHKNGRKRQLHTIRSLLRGRKGATLVELVIDVYKRQELYHTEL